MKRTMSSSLSKLDDSILDIQDSQSEHFHYVMSVTLKELLAPIICYSPAPPYSVLFYAAIKPEKLAAGWWTSDFTVRFAMFGVPTSAGEVEENLLNQSKKQVDDQRCY
jgi:hypothetical protein